jgi:hypothetical protein
VSSAPRDPAPLGALFEAAFRRFGSRVTSYTLYSIAVAVIPAAVIAPLHPSNVHPLSNTNLSAVVSAIVFSNLLLAGILTALVTGTLRRRAFHLLIAALGSALMIGAVWAAVGFFAAVLYPLVVFAPIAAAAGDASGPRSLLVGLRLAVRDWGRSYGALVGLGLCGGILFGGFLVTLSPVDGSARFVAAIALTVLLLSPIAALVERNLYGDLTGRTVLPESVSRLQTERGKRQKPARKRG